MTVPDVYTLTRRGLWQGARASVPLGVASAVLGAGFGVAARQVDLALWATVFMSGSVFAGAAQFAVLPLWSAPLPLAPIWFSTFAVNARFALLSASLTSWLRHYRGATPWVTAGLLGEAGEVLRQGSHRWLLFDPQARARWTGQDSLSRAANQPLLGSELRGQVRATGLTAPGSWSLPAAGCQSD